MEAAAGRWRGSRAEGQRFLESSPDVCEVNSRRKKRGRRAAVDPLGDNPLKAVFWRGLAAARTRLRTVRRVEIRNGIQVFVWLPPQPVASQRSGPACTLNHEE